MSAGGVLPVQGSDRVLDDASAARQLLEYSRAERQGCGARYEDAIKFYTSDHTFGTNKVGRW